jgi:hypothetical protein
VHPFFIYSDVDALPAHTTPARTPAPIAGAETQHSWAIEVSGQCAYTTVPIRGGTTPFGVGFGGRFGVVAFGGVYLGISVVDYLGGTDIAISDRSIMGGLEIGYGFDIALGKGHLTLRPQLGVGDVRIIHTDPSLLTAPSVDVVTSASGHSSSSSDETIVDNLYIAPSFTLLYAYGAPFIGLSAKVLVVPGITYGGDTPSTWLSYGLQAELGYRF